MNDIWEGMGLDDAQFLIVFVVFEKGIDGAMEQGQTGAQGLGFIFPLLVEVLAFAPLVRAGDERLGAEVKFRGTHPAKAAWGDPLNDEVIRGLQVNDGIEFAVQFLEHFVEENGLERSAGVAVKDNAGFGMSGPDPFFEHAIDNVVGDQIAVFEVFFGSQAHGSAVFYGLTEQVAWTKMLHAEGVFELLNLSAFSDTAGADECHVHGRIRFKVRAWWLAVSGKGD